MTITNTSKAVQKWVNGEVERISMRLERYKTANSGYNRIPPIIISKSVTSILSNPKPLENQPAGVTGPPRGILSRTDPETEDIYASIAYNNNVHNNSSDFNSSSITSIQEESPSTRKFTYYRSCSTRIT